MKEIDLGEMKLLINKVLDMLLSEQQIIQTQMRRAWLGDLKIIVTEIKDIGLGEMKLIIDKMLEMLLDTKECIVWQEVILFQIIRIWEKWIILVSIVVLRNFLMKHIFYVAIMER